MNSDGRLKAYWVEVKDNDWGMFIHAESPGKAKHAYFYANPDAGDPDFTELRATRAIGAEMLDIVPFTDYSLRLAGYNFDWDDMDNDSFLDFCACPMCTAEKAKSTVKVSLKIESLSFEMEA